MRLDTFIESGSKIPPFYDSMVAKLIVWDSDRDAAIARATRALHETVIEGVPTTRDLAIEVLASEPFRTGDYSTSTLPPAGGDDVTTPADRPRHDHDPGESSRGSCWSQPDDRTASTCASSNRCRMVNERVRLVVAASGRARYVPLAERV